MQKCQFDCLTDAEVEVQCRRKNMPGTPIFKFLLCWNCYGKVQQAGFNILGTSKVMLKQGGVR